MVGRTVDEEREAESKRVSVGVDGVALIKVDWLLRGIVRDEGGIFALVAAPRTSAAFCGRRHSAWRRASGEHH